MYIPNKTTEKNMKRFINSSEYRYCYETETRAVFEIIDLFQWSEISQQNYRIVNPIIRGYSINNPSVIGVVECLDISMIELKDWEKLQKDFNNLMKNFKE